MTKFNISFRRISSIRYFILCHLTKFIIASWLKLWIHQKKLNEEPSWQLEIWDQNL